MSFSVGSVLVFFPFKYWKLCAIVLVTFSSQFDSSEADNEASKIHFAVSRRERSLSFSLSHMVNQGYLSFNSAESYVPRRICPRMLARCRGSFLPFIRPSFTQLEGQKGELISISPRGRRVYSQTSLPAAAGDGELSQPLAPAFPLWLSLFLVHPLSSPFASLRQPF